MLKGTVKIWKADQGYGFIVPDLGGPNMFVHLSEVRRARMNFLTRGLRVGFGIGDANTRPVANKLCLLDAGRFPAPRYEGQVVSFNPRSGYGFIQQNNGTKLFVHISEVRESGIDMLEPHQRVSYEIYRDHNDRPAAWMITTR